MNFLFAYKMAIKSIWDNKVRSFLTMLGVIIGVAAVISAVGFAESSMSTITNMIEGMGSNMISVMITDMTASRELTLDDLERLDSSTQYVKNISPYIMAKDAAKYKTENWNTTIVGTNASYIESGGGKIDTGRFIMDTDIDKTAKVAVIGSRGKMELFPNEDPLGKVIKIKGVQFTIVGVLKSVANGAKGTDDDMVFIPVNVAQRTLKITKVSMFMAEANSNETIDIAKQKIKDFLYDIYKKEDSYVVITQESMLGVLGDVTSIMMVVMGSIATISLVVGGIGIMNIMLVSVTERTREIGIRKAIGAKKKDILKQFLIESLMLTGIGGIIGIIFGVCIIKFGIGSISIITPVYSIPWIIASFLIAVVIGVTFGIFPAYKAANLNPIDALRSE